MSHSFRCRECGSPNPLFEAINESLLTISGETSLESALTKVSEVARSLVHASYAVVGVVEDDGFGRVIVSGTTPEHAAPVSGAARRGLLWKTFLEGLPLVTSDLESHPGFGGWPEGHPPMRSVLGVPLVSRGEAIGGMFLANENTWGFSPDDRAVVEVLATHAALAVDNSRLLEQSRELSIVQERNRLARELHDSVNQMLFSIGLGTETGLMLMDSDVEAAKVQMKKISEIARDAQREMRSLIFELRPRDLASDGLGVTLERHVEALRSIYPVDVELGCRGAEGLPGDVQDQMFRILQEALNNAMKHARAGRVRVGVERSEEEALGSVIDDGVGFDLSTAGRAGHLGLTSMQERAALLGGSIDIRSQPGRGTEVRVRLPLEGSDR